ncbi:MAG: hypothetical protein FJ088_15445, partial [Deltaproteobacteria bacterium]|nr:hypothetical protein [Deltaproteobacteria bacterium]
MTGIAANIACMSAGALVFAGLLFVYLYVFIKKNPLFPVLAVSCLTLILINVAAGLQARFFAEKETLVSILRFKYISGVSFIAVAPLIVYFLTKKNFMKVSFYIFLPLSALTMAVVMTQSFISTTVNVSSGDIMLTYAGGFRLFSAAVLASVLLSIATLFFDAVRTKVRTRRRLLISFLLGGLALFAGGILEARRDLGNEAAALSPFTAGSLFWGAVLLFDIAREFGNNLRTLKGLRSLISKKSFEAIKDPLTSLFNRGYLMEGIHQAIEKLKRHK